MAEDAISLGIFEATECDPPDGGVARDGVQWLRVVAFGVKLEDPRTLEVIGVTMFVPALFTELQLRMESQDGRWRLTGVVTPECELRAKPLHALPLGKLSELAALVLSDSTDTEPPQVRAPRVRSQRADDWYYDLVSLYKYACDHPEPGYVGKPIKWMTEKGYDPGNPRRPKRSWIVDRMDRAQRLGFIDRDQGKPGYKSQPKEES